jgi:peptidoglycan/LPS O-acetylase OafA/YrhL
LAQVAFRFPFLITGVSLRVLNHSERMKRHNLLGMLILAAIVLLVAAVVIPCLVPATRGVNERVESGGLVERKR